MPFTLSGIVLLLLAHFSGCYLTLVWGFLFFVSGLGTVICVVHGWWLWRSCYTLPFASTQRQSELILDSLVVAQMELSLVHEVISWKFLREA